MDVNMTGVNSYGSDSDVGGVLNSTAMNGNNLQPNGVYIADAIITGLVSTSLILIVGKSYPSNTSRLPVQSL